MTQYPPSCTVVHMTQTTDPDPDVQAAREAALSHQQLKETRTAQLRVLARNLEAAKRALQVAITARDDAARAAYHEDLLRPIEIQQALGISKQRLVVLRGPLTPGTTTANGTRS